MIDNEVLKANIARNITEYRKAEGLTQLEVAEKLNYTDKAVSKWERGESIPDVVVLMQLAELYGITIGDLTSEKHRPKIAMSLKKFTRHKLFIPILSAGLAWLAATIAFAFLVMLGYTTYAWMAFLYALPASLIVLLVFNAIWGNKIFAFVIVSALSWSLILGVVVPLLLFTNVPNPWWLLLIGIPFQALVALWYAMRLRKK